MNLSDFKIALMRYGFDAEDPLQVWINAAMHEIETFADWPFLEREASVAVGIGLDTLPQPTYYGKMISVSDITEVQTQGGQATELEYWNRTKWKREVTIPTQRGCPYAYTLIGGDIVGGGGGRDLEEIHIYPVADKDRTFKLLYNAQALDLQEDEDIPSWLSTRWHYGIVYGSAAIALMAENEEERAQTAMAQRDNVLDRMNTYYGLRELGIEEQTADDQGYFG